VVSGQCDKDEEKKMADTEKPSITVREAGRRGGQVTARKHGPEHYERIGRIGGQRMKSLLAKGKAVEEDHERETP
jgi:uncharacterized protein